MKTSLKSIKTDTSKFEFSHGRKPKGFGYWAFWIESSMGSTPWSFRGLYSEACKSAKRTAQKFNATQITVLP